MENGVHRLNGTRDLNRLHQLTAWVVPLVHYAFVSQFVSTSLLNLNLYSLHPLCISFQLRHKASLLVPVTHLNSAVNLSCSLRLSEECI